MGAFDQLVDNLDPDDRIKGKQFQHICKWFLTNDPLYKARLRHVWLWKEWPDREAITGASAPVALNCMGVLRAALSGMGTKGTINGQSE